MNLRKSERDIDLLLCFLENGAYNKAWASIHMMPEEVVQTEIDLKAKKIMPIH